MTIVKIDASKIHDWKSFHKYFKKLFGFPDFYGNNYNAWKDCMGSLDNASHGMNANVSVKEGELVVFDITNVDTLFPDNRDILDGIVEGTSSINHHRIRSGQPPLFVLSFKKRF